MEVVAAVVDGVDIQPIASFLVPLFFVVTGMQVDVRGLFAPGALLFAAALAAVAIVGKQASAAGVVMRGASRLVVGTGMIPRGEVGLIFAPAGAAMVRDGCPVLGATAFAAVVGTVLVTTMVTPPALQRALARAQRRRI